MLPYTRLEQAGPEQNRLVLAVGVDPSVSGEMQGVIQTLRHTLVIFAGSVLKVEK